MAKNRQTTDPHAEREAARYDNPIPSREFILTQLDEAERPLTFDEVAQRLELGEPAQKDALRARLRAMQRDGQILVDRRGAYGVVQHMHLQRCRVIGHRDGYGFASPTQGGDDFFLSARQMRSVLDSDIVLVAETGRDSRGRPEGEVVEVLERGVKRIVGRYQEESGIGMVVPDNARISQDFLIPPKAKGGAKSGQIVEALITQYPSGRLGGKAEIIEVLGEHMDPGMEIDIAIRAHGIPHEWPEAVIDAAGALDHEPLDADKHHRVDLRDLPFVTIDGEDAKDFDDAVYCEQNKQGWTLWVAIADVSHYVRPGSALDQEAALRATSVYFPGRVVPMLPEVLSNGLCSLKPEVDRLSMVAELSINRDGELESSVFYEGVIHSHARLTYTRVAAVLAGDDSVNGQIDAGLQRLHGLYRALRRQRELRGAIDFETVETQIIFDEQRKIEAIVPVQRNDAHKLIEECMLCANVATAQLLESLDIPALYRVHEGPTAEKLENLRQFLGELGLDLRGGEKPTPSDYQQLLAEIQDRPDAHIIQTMLLRSLRQAVYQPDNEGHFGLNYEGYAHFTSPIRRYPDLLVHRAIRSVIRSRRKCQRVRRVRGARAIDPGKIYPYDFAAMVVLGEQCSHAERRADDATRDAEAWLKCEYLLEHVGDEFEGVVSAVTSFGLFVELRDLYVEGLVHVTALPGDYYRFDHAQQRLVGERSGQTFHLGDTVRVKVARVSLDDKKIDLEMLSLERSARGGRGSGKSGKGKKEGRGGGRRQASARSDRGKSERKGKSGKKGRGSGSATRRRR